MAKNEEVEMIFEGLQSSNPLLIFKKMNETSFGIGAVLRYLDEANETVTAGKISEFLSVSTARVAAILKKMEQKGLVEKLSDENDGRKTVVKISVLGQHTVSEMKAQVKAHIGEVIDKVGMEKMLEFIEITKEIKAVMKMPNINL